ncbi:MULTISPECIES: activator-dependent family glycosyltransferase [Aeromicrobium]|uniref:EryBV L-mycarosyltransferase n=1 Tax=Aeromicrobium erythreum TaxID=2041 RepID=A0A0U4B0M4_9ACTN|nr:MULTISPECIES: activator-dependent family glycosyltransferase [Aeromicrobium]ALX06080.1 EryBV L-mycarosyltransferase [Aeromicrobium erythreum]
MKVLFTSFAHRTHFQGLVPLAWALTLAGHQVRVASQPDLVDDIVSAGLVAVPVGVDHRLFEIDPAEATEVHRYSTGLDFARRHDELHSWDFLLGLETANARSVFPRVNNPEFVAGLVDHARRWQPDLVLWEPFTFAGAVAARASGAAHARVAWGTDLTGYFRSHFLALRADQEENRRRPDPLADWLRDVASEHGVEATPDLALGQWTVEQIPARFRLPSGLDITPGTTSAPYNGPSRTPSWLDDGRRRIAVTGGFSGLGDGADLPELLARLADLDHEVVVTRSGLAPDQVQSNVRLVDFVPMNALMESCDVVVHHGGAGTWASALHQAVPQVAVAHEWDCLLRGQQVADAGAGLSLDPQQTDAATLADAVRSVLDQPTYRAQARALREELRAEPTPTAVAQEIERRTVAART